jgi:hypothetical protein
MQVDLRGGAGRIEALVEEPAGGVAPRFAALVLHPHPLFGGSMHNHATYRIARAARGAGGATLRTNFRGVGLSAGHHDAGEGESEDARAAVGWLAGRYPALPLFASGFSFGAWIALRVGCADGRVRGILAAGVASRTFDLEFLPGCDRPVAAVQAADDEFGSVEKVRLLLAGPPHRRRLAVVERATHLFAEDLEGLEREAALSWAWLLGVSA